MKDIKKIRKTVATMANQLHKLGYSLSQAFRTAWKRAKKSMKCRVSGVTYKNRQRLLKLIGSIKGICSSAYAFSFGVKCSADQQCQRS